MVLSFNEIQLHELNLGRIYQHSKDSNIGMITAFRGEFDLDTNEKRNRELMAAIRSNGFGFVPVTGFYVENPGLDDEQKVQEKSFLVISNKKDGGKLKHFLFRMGVKFNQDSVLYKDSSDDKAILMGTASGRWPGKNVEVVAGKFAAQKIGQFYTRMRNHKTFVFESVEPEENLMSRAYRERSEKQSK
jgi:hypothetical protein